METVNYSQFNFGKRLREYMHEVFNHSGVTRTEAELTDGQKVFLKAIKRELLKYVDTGRTGYPHNQLEQMESFTRTIGDLHNSYFDNGMHKISDCLFNRWRMLFEETKKLAAAGGASQPCWIEKIEVEQSDMPMFFDA
ncbi:hypothetical protein ACFDAU_03815 [Sulfuriferula sp. GW1]|uniref:hypothetical protein n=1 Tax=Sulfuriferula sp. GW1 TaxID=3345111 RepID=UPI0039AF5AC9